MAAVALLAVALALLRLGALERGVETVEARVGATPVTVHRLAGAPPAPVVVIAHGFSGSRPLMRGFATTAARNGYVAVSFDFLGHGRHPEPMTGDVTREDGATAALVAQLDAVATWARAQPGVEGGLAVLGHSMAGDVIARWAVAQGEAVSATIGVSMFSPVVTADAPRNLLMISGAWEGWLADESLRVLRLSHGADAAMGATYGDPAAGTARRAVTAPAVEHIGVLYSRTAMAETAAWLDAAFGRRGPGFADHRGPWVALLLAGLVALGWPLARLIPRLSPPQGAALGGWRFAVAALAPAVLTPLLLAPLDLRFLPVAVGDYLATHFALYGVLTAAAMAALGAARPRAVPWGRLALAAAGAAAFALGALGWALDAHVSAFLPIPARLPLLAALLVGTAGWFLADEWLTRGPGAPRLAYPATKLAFLASLAAAVALDLERLFFLIILAPALVLFFVVYGLFSRWSFARAGHPWVGGLANAVVFAWAIAVTFPMLAP